MKKILLTALAALLMLPGIAQTNFRHISYEEAIAAAKAENKLVFMDFYTDWCGPCKMMMRDVFPQKQVGDFMNSKFVCIKLNAEKEGAELAKLYKVNAYPTFVAIDANKKEVFTKVGGGDAEAFVAEIKRLLNPDMTPERMKARYEGGERSAELVSSYAAWLMSQTYDRKNRKQMRDQSYQMVRDYYANLTDAQRLAPENLFVYTDFVESTEDAPARFMVSHRDEFKGNAKETIASTIKELYQNEVYAYLGGQKKYDAATFNAFKKELNDLGLNDKKQYDPAFEFIECYGKGDLNAYLDLCEKSYKQLPENFQTQIIMNFGSLIATKDAATLKRASKFVRSQLADMPVNNLYFVTMQLAQLEGLTH